MNNSISPKLVDQLPLDDATQNWKEKTKNCGKTLAIQRVALAALALIGAAVFVTGLFLLPPISVALSVCAGVIGVTSSSFGLSAFLVSLVFCNNYGNPKTAQKIVNQLKTCKLGDLRESEFSSDHAGKIGYLAENGFINDQIVGSIESMIESWRALKNQEISLLHSRNYEAKLQTISQIRALEAEWNKYRTDYIVPYLPSPLTVQ